jgi:hypothetical protein
MRTIKELLELLLNNQHLFNNGLCLWVNHLYCFNLISHKESKIMKNYIERNRPSMFSSIDAFTQVGSEYYWERGNIKPRIKWIKKHIKLNS